jgi:charged multivesicular body protein 7
MYVIPLSQLTAAQVCVGRTEAEFEEQGTGTGLYIMTGPELTDYENPPNTQAEVELTDWKHGYCFVSMGEKITLP